MNWGQFDCGRFDWSRFDWKSVEHGGLNDAIKHSVTESTELNPGCQQPFLFDKMSSAAKTPAAKKSAAKKAVKSQKKKH